jgi:hypothetical protein
VATQRDHAGTTPTPPQPRAPTMLPKHNINNLFIKGAPHPDFPKTLAKEVGRFLILPSSTGPSLKSLGAPPSLGFMRLRKTWVRDILDWPRHQHLSNRRDDRCSTTPVGSLRQIRFGSLFCWSWTVLVIFIFFHMLLFIVSLSFMLWLSATFVHSGALVPRRSTPPYDGRRISFVRSRTLGFFFNLCLSISAFPIMCMLFMFVYISRVN